MTLDWLQIVFGAEDVTKGKYINFEKDFADHKAKTDDGNNAALFFHNNTYGLGRTYFFPRIRCTFWNELIKKYPLVSYSPKPNASSLTVAVGDESHRKIWFNA